MGEAFYECSHSFDIVARTMIITDNTIIYHWHHRQNFFTSKFATWRKYSPAVVWRRTWVAPSGNLVDANAYNTGNSFAIIGMWSIDCIWRSPEFTTSNCDYYCKVNCSKDKQVMLVLNNGKLSLIFKMLSQV